MRKILATALLVIFIKTILASSITSSLVIVYSDATFLAPKSFLLNKDEEIQLFLKYCTLISQTGDSVSEIHRQVAERRARNLKQITVQKWNLSAEQYRGFSWYMGEKILIGINHDEIKILEKDGTEIKIFPKGQVFKSDHLQKIILQNIVGKEAIAPVTAVQTELRSSGSAHAVLQSYFAHFRRLGVAYSDFSNENETLKRFMGMFNWFGTNEKWENPRILKEMNGRRGVYLGVAFGGQNLSRLCHGDFDKAVIVDTNPAVTEIFLPLRNAMISMRRNRAEYLSLLSGIKLTEEEIARLEYDSLEKIYEHLNARLLALRREDKTMRTPFRIALRETIVKGFPEELQTTVEEFLEYYNQYNLIFLR